MRGEADLDCERRLFARRVAVSPARRRPAPQGDGIDDVGARAADLRAGSRPAERDGNAATAGYGRFAKTLRGDLDNVVLKALKKAPEERYASAEQLSEDLRRYLRGFPVDSAAGHDQLSRAQVRATSPVRGSRRGIVRPCVDRRDRDDELASTPRRRRAIARRASLERRARAHERLPRRCLRCSGLPSRRHQGAQAPGRELDQVSAGPGARCAGLAAAATRPGESLTTASATCKATTSARMSATRRVRSRVIGVPCNLQRGLVKHDPTHRSAPRAAAQLREAQRAADGPERRCRKHCLSRAKARNWRTRCWQDKAATRARPTLRRSGVHELRLGAGTQHRRESIQA